MNYDEEIIKIRNKISELSERKKAIYKGEQINYTVVLNRLDEIMILQQQLYEDYLELMPEVEKLIVLVETAIKQKKRELYEKIKSDSNINKSNRLTVLDLESSDIDYYLSNLKSLKKEIEGYIEANKERLWTIRALKKSFTY